MTNTSVDKLERINYMEDKHKENQSQIVLARIRFKSGVLTSCAMCPVSHKIEESTTNWPTLKSSSFAEKCLGTPSRFRPDRKINTQESSLTTESTKSSIVNVKWSH